MGMGCKYEYAVYKGDDFMDVGDMNYLSRSLGIPVRVLRWYSTPTWRRRSGGRGIQVFRLEDDK